MCQKMSSKTVLHSVEQQCFNARWGHNEHFSDHLNTHLLVTRLWKYISRPNIFQMNFGCENAYTGNTLSH